jgi:hypothetical protein
MNRIRTILGVAATVSALLVTPALAAPPEPADDTIEVAGICDFPVLLEFTGKVKVIEHGDHIITVAPGQKVTVTNMETDESLRYNIAGAFHDQVQPNGDLVSKGTGRNLLFTEALGMLVTVGNVAFTVTEDASAPEGIAITITGNRGKIIDVCAALAG